MQKNGAEIVVETLINHGVTDVFGYPGGAVLDLYDALYKNSSRINHYITCHEQGAAHAADGYARSTGKVGVVIATSGPGATNLVTGVATAYLDSVPMVAITGNVPLPLIGKDSFQEVDITGITMPITKHNFFVKNVNELEEIICDAFQIAASGRPGPVLIDIPKNIQSEMYEFKGKNPRPLFPPNIVYDDKLAEVAEIINSARRPYIYCGGGAVISNVSQELAMFAEKIDAVIGCSMMGLSAVSSSNPLALGMTGMHGTYASSKMKSEADVIIGIGVRFSDRATGDKVAYQKDTKIIHIDIDDAEIDKNIPTTCSVLGDIKAIIPRLTKLVNANKHDDWHKLALKYKEFANEKFNQGGFNPRNIIKTVCKAATPDTVVATDVGQHQMWTAQYYDFEHPRTFLTSGGLGTMGFGVGATNGASVAMKNGKTVLFTGDGSFHMNLNEVATAVRYKLPIVIILMNNSVLGMVRQWQELFYDKRYSQTIMDRPTNYVKLADAFGAVGYDASTQAELETALQVAFKSEKPVIINCIIDSEEKVLPMIPPGKAVSDMIID
ncbi:MAG: biosynthetic-type acetolactate synthase large subunit [Oscillospiraceae bacterium]|nr:biosynthetic-type acetolactate synthase large subunit [Oscillospiraceae bacterium]